MNKLKEYFSKIRERAVENFGTSFFHDPIMLSLAGIFAIILIVILLIIIFRIQPADVTVPMNYNIVYGVTTTAFWFDLYYYLIAATIMGLLNLVIAWAFFDKERLISYLVGFVNILVGILFAISIFNLTALIR